MFTLLYHNINDDYFDNNFGFYPTASFKNDPVTGYEIIILIYE